MKSQHVKFSLAVGWMLLAVGVVAALGYLKSPSDAVMLAVFALAPPTAMWFWWNDPAETLSESIRAVNRNDADKASPRQPS
jgi:hypothetical protein